MQRDRLSIGFSLVLAVLILSSCRDQSGSSPQAPALALGTSSVGSAFYSLSIGMAEVVTESTGINLTVEPVGGSDANMRALGDHKIDLAMLNSDGAVAGFTGTAQFEGEAKIPVALIAQGQPSLRQIVARGDAGIHSPRDLLGKRFIGKRRALSEMARFSTALLSVYGIREDQLTLIETAETNEAIDALKIGSVQAAIIPGGVPASTLTDLTETTDVQFISIPDPQLQGILESLGSAFRKGTIPANTYRGQAKEVTTPALTALLVARKDLSEDLVYQLTKALMTNSSKIQAVHSAGKLWTIQAALESPPIPFHPGAARYFQEIEGQAGASLAQGQ